MLKMFGEDHPFFWTYAAWSALLFAICAGVLLDIFNRRSSDDSGHAALWALMVMIQPLVVFFLYITFGRSRNDTVGRVIALSSLKFRRAARKDGALKKYLDSAAEYQTSGNGYGEASAAFSLLDRMMPETYPLRGNTIELLHDGTAAYPAMLRAINNAKKTISLQSFIIANDEAGHTIFAALRRKALEGVEVKVLYDRFGSFYAAHSRLFRKYSDGCPSFTIRPFSVSNSFFQWNFQFRNHRKLMIVDAKTAFLGGINISGENVKFKNKSEKFIHDLHCRVTGPAVGELMLIFMRDWYYAGGSLPSEEPEVPLFPSAGHDGKAEIRVIGSGFGQIYQGSENVFAAAASSARKSLWIISPYFVPDKPFVKMLRMAALRGVDVRVIVPKLNNHFYVKYASRSLYYSLLNDGVRIFERRDVFVHTKAMLVDNEWGMIGSSNCDVRSFRLNMELDIVVRGEEFIGSLYEEFTGEMNFSEEISIRAVEGKSAFRRIAENVCSLLTPLL